MKAYSKWRDNGSKRSNMNAENHELEKTLHKAKKIIKHFLGKIPNITFDTIYIWEKPNFLLGNKYLSGKVFK